MPATFISNKEKAMERLKLTENLEHRIDENPWLKEIIKETMEYCSDGTEDFTEKVEAFIKHHSPLPTVSKLIASRSKSVFVKTGSTAGQFFNALGSGDVEDIFRMVAEGKAINDIKSAPKTLDDVFNDDPQDLLDEPMPISRPKIPIGWSDEQMKDNRPTQDQVRNKIAAGNDSYVHLECQQRGCVHPTIMNMTKSAYVGNESKYRCAKCNSLLAVTPVDTRKPQS